MFNVKSAQFQLSNDATFTACGTHRLPTSRERPRGTSAAAEGGHSPLLCDAQFCQFHPDGRANGPCVTCIPTTELRQLNKPGLWHRQHGCRPASRTWPIAVRQFTARTHSQLGFMKARDRSASTFSGLLSTSPGADPLLERDPTLAAIWETLPLQLNRARSR